MGDSATMSPQPPTGLMSTERSQYHHHVPRFILRNFAHYSDKAKAKKRKQKHQKRIDPDMLNVLQLEPEVKKAEMPLARAFGQRDMYRDFQKPVNQQHVEIQLGKLECIVAPIFHKIRKAQESGLSAVRLLRSERDELRRFLFVMRYRGSNQHKRFFDKDIDSYNAKDKGSLLQHMRERGFEKPIEVWLDNIKTMAEVKIDKEGTWFAEILQRIYHRDADWAFVNMQAMYLAFCTPSNPDDEFLLTENAHDIFEGPVSFTLDPLTGEKNTTACTEYHNFSAISPRVIAVLRSTLLPNTEEDNIPGVRESRHLERELHRCMHSAYDLTASFLEDLPVTKARNSYTTIVDGAPRLIDGEDGSPKPHHTFDFKLFPLASRHVQKINAVILNESHNSSSIAFASHGAARRALEFYLTASCNEPGAYPLKIVSDPYDPTLLQLQKLEKAVALLGATARLMFNVDADDSGRDFLFEQTVFEEIRRRAAEIRGHTYTGNQFTPPLPWQYQYFLPEVYEHLERLQEKEREEQRSGKEELEKKKPEEEGPENEELEKKKPEEEGPGNEKNKPKDKGPEKKQQRKGAQHKYGHLQANEEGSKLQKNAPKPSKRAAKRLARQKAAKSRSLQNDESNSRPPFYLIILATFILGLIWGLRFVYYRLFTFLWKSYSWTRYFLSRKADLHLEPDAAHSEKSTPDRVDTGLGSEGSMGSASSNETNDEANFADGVLIMLTVYATFITVVVACWYCLNLYVKGTEGLITWVWETVRGLRV
ncbi:uncharacterized protein BKCO1_2700091 [Diplodia corticola]|uniref:Uncharacterized protein n=1 Tax=Diplodia corticola TaxID=236234 RepID=A0A1J9S1H4_9PEZI|nr:uncharacterized protein BKCO1_2700091 [Diplodia corticola]OJD33868.1 hypothetical protein BKCO1_2700091 [Diplodia corticola]